MVQGLLPRDKYEVRTKSPDDLSDKDGSGGSLWAGNGRNESETAEPSSKRKRINTAAEWEVASNTTAIIPKRNKSLLEIEEDELASIEGYYGQLVNIY